MTCARDIKILGFPNLGSRYQSASHSGYFLLEQSTDGAGCHKRKSSSGSGEGFQSIWVPQGVLPENALEVLKSGCHLFCSGLEGLEKLCVLNLAQLSSFKYRVKEIFKVTLVVAKSFIDSSKRI